MIFLWVYLTTAVFMATQQWRMSSPHAEPWPRFAISVLYGVIPLLWFIVIGGISSVNAKARTVELAGK